MTEKIKEATKISFDKFGRERRTKISKLCEHCPNDNCAGFYRKDAPRACLTFYAWKEGKLLLEEAIDTKYKQHERHKKTDKFKDEIYPILENYTFDYESRVIAGSIASDLVKGIPIDEALNGFYINEKDKGKIEAILKDLNATHL